MKVSSFDKSRAYLVPLYKKNQKACVNQGRAWAPSVLRDGFSRENIVFWIYENRSKSVNVYFFVKISHCRADENTILVSKDYFVERSKAAGCCSGWAI